MPLPLSPPIRITKDDLGLFSDFKCGQENYQHALAVWITGEEAIKALKGKTRIFAYATARVPEQVVGYGSLGTSNWKLADDESDKVKVQIIPALAVHEKYWGQGVCKQIVDHLVNEAQQNVNASLLLGLFVHEKNDAAIHVYQAAGFKFLRKEVVDETGINRAMIRSL